MTLSPSWFPVLAESLETALMGARVGKIRAPARDRLLVSWKASGSRFHLLLCMHPHFPRLHLVAEAPPALPTPPDFVMLLRKHLQRAKLASVLAVPGDRVIELGFQAGGKPLRLVAECIPGKPNLVLVDAEGAVVASHGTGRYGGRLLAPGQPYRHPDRPDRAFPEALDPLPPPGCRDRHAWLAETFCRREAEHGLDRLAASVRRRLRRLLRKEEKRLVNLARDRASAGDPERWRQQGELLKIHAGRLEKGLASIEVPDLFAPGTPPVRIPLDPRLDLAGNMEAFFRKYRKALSGREKIASMIEEAEGARRDHAARLSDLETFVAEGRAEAVRDLAARLGVRAPEEGGGKPRRKAGPAPRLPFRRFESREGFPIWVGRNDAENDRLTAREARGRDLWFHADGWPGSHVLVRVPKDRQASQETLLDAGNLALFFSKARGKRADVSYTEARHVRKSRKAKPGAVSLSRRSTLRIEPDAKRLERLLGKPHSP